MKHVVSFRSWTLAISLLLLASLTALHAQAQAVTNYWDINGSIPGAGGPTPSGNWEDPTWSTDPTGSIPTGLWTEGNVPVFSAGTDATGAYTITANSDHTIAGMQAPSGTVTVDGAGILSITNGMQEFAGTNLTIETTLGGSGGFESAVSNNVYLYNDNNTYSGGTSLNGGSTYLSGASSLGTGTVSPILGGASPTFSALYSTLNTITLTNNFSINTSNAGIVFVPGTTTPLTLSGNFDLQQDFNCRNNGPGSSANPGLVTGILTLSGNISGPGGMILSCNGDNNSTIALYGANTYTGRTTVDTNGGTRTFINFNTAQPIGSGIPNSLGEPPDATTGQINLGHPANPTTGFADALRYTGSTDSTTDRTINNANADPAPGSMWLFAEGTGAITYSGNITAAASTTNRTLIVQGSSTALNTISGTISDGTGGGVINVTKESPSTWRLLGTNTFTGALTVQNTTGLGGTSTLILGGSNAYAGTTAISANSVLQLAGPNPVPHGPGHGSFTIAANGKFELAGFNCSIDGGGGAGMIDNNTGTATLIIDNNGVNQGPIFSGPIQDSGSGVLNFIVNCGGDCQVTSSTGNPYHGYTEVNNGILQFTNDNHLGVVPATLVTNIIIDSALNWNGTSNSANYYFRLQGSSTINLNANRGIYLGNSNGYGGGIGAQSSATLNVNGPITGPGALFSGGGTPHAATGIVVLFGANMYSGPTYVVGGTLRLGANNVLPFGTPVTISDSQSVTFAMNNKSQTIGPLTGVNNFSLINLNGALTIRETSPTTFAGVISQAGGSLILDPASTSALTLTATNTYTGTTVINGGTLALSGGGSIAASSSITIGSKGTFSVAGMNTALTLSNAQPLNVSATGGFSATIATAAGKGLTLGATGPLNFTAYDGSTVPLALSGAGSMTLAAGNPVTVTVAGSPLAAGSYKLISKGASGSVAGTAPTSLTIAGAGTVAGAANSLSINNGELYLNVVGGLSPVTHMSIASAGGGNLSISYSGGTGSQFVLLQSTNVAAPLFTWAKVQTNAAPSGTFTIGTSTNAAAFYKIQSQ